MKIRYLALVFFIILTGLVRAERIKLTDDTYREGQLRIQERKCFIDGKEFNIEKVSEVSFDLKTEMMTKADEKIVKSSEPYTVSEVVEMVNEAEKLKTPGIKGIVVLDEGVFNWEKDGTRSYTYHFIGRILKESGRSWGKIGRGFDEDRKRIKILLARTISPDGKSVKYLKTRDIKISDPAGRSQFFSTYKTLSAVIPGVSNDSIVEYIIETDTFNPMDTNIFSASYFFRDYVPVRKSKVTVRFPSTKKMHYIARRMGKKSSKPVVRKNDDFISYIWEKKDVPMIVSEPFMPPYNQIAPVVKCSPFENWDYLNEFSGKMLKKNIKLTPEIRRKVSELVKDARTVHERIASIYYFCQQEIRYISIKSSFSSGWAGHPAGHTLKNRYGDCIDKSILFATMMKAIDVEAYPVGVVTNTAGNMDVEIPIFNANHAISEIHLNGDIFYLDCTATTYRYPYFRPDDHGIWASNEILGKFHKIPVPPPEDNMYTQFKRLQLENNGDTVVTYTNQFTGAQEANSRSYWQSVKESERKRVFQRSVNSINPGAEVLDFNFSEILDLSVPFTYSAGYRLNGYGKIAGNLMIFKIPGFSRSFSSISLPDRKYDVHYESSDCQRRRTIIDIPSGYSIKFLPERMKIENDYIAYEAQYIDFNDQIYFEDVLQFKKRIVPVRDYQEFRKDLQAVARYSDEQIFLEKKEAKQ